MAKVLFFSYNMIPFADTQRSTQMGHGISAIRTGQIDQQAHIITGSIVNQRRDLDSVSAEVEAMIQKVPPDISVFDKVIVYLGSVGTEKVVEFARSVPLEKLIIVTCACSKKMKIRLFKEIGIKKSQVIPCNCGGQKAMSSLITAYLNAGEPVDGKFFRKFSLSMKCRVLPELSALVKP